MDFLSKSLKTIKTTFGLENDANMVTPERFEFHDEFTVDDDDDILNGLRFNDVYVPVEIISYILSFLDARELLANCSLVCKSWCNLVKSTPFWHTFYVRRQGRTKIVPHLPWYVFYCYFATDNFTNLLKNGNGQDGYDRWKIIRNGGDRFKIEDPPEYTDALPLDVPEFYGRTGCFVTSYDLCFKVQEISLVNKRLLRYILLKYKPALYVSEWWAARHDCGCLYQLSVRCCTERDEIRYDQERHLPQGFRQIDSRQVDLPYLYVTEKASAGQWERQHWSKVELEITNYNPEMTKIVFGHEGRDTLFWKGHYGSKMAGGVVRFLFESIQTYDVDD